MSQITEEQIRKMKHALGISHDNNGRYSVPNKIYRPKLRSFRNYYQIEQCDDWDDLVKKGLATKGNRIGMNYYFVTEYGMSYLREIGYTFAKDHQ